MTDQTSTIPNGWKETTLGQILRVKHGFAFSGENITDQENKNILLTPGNFLIGGGWKNGKKFFNGDIPEDYILKANDLIVTMTDLSKEGDTLGYPALIPNEPSKKFLHNQRVGLVLVDEEGADKKYIYFFLRFSDYQKYIINTASGSTVRHTSPSKIQDYEFAIPPLPEQKAIAAVLSSFDDKIELLREQNKTLEATAQAIFKEWFIDFNFPIPLIEGCPKGGVDSSCGCPKGGVDSSCGCPKGGVDSSPLWQKKSLFPYWLLPKNYKLKERAKELRKQGILSEVVFWQTFKDKKKLGWDIDRQVIIGNFIVDFFIPELGLVFEIDGLSHDEKQEYDRERDAFLTSLELKVERIADKEVLQNINAVWDFVNEKIKNRVEELRKNPPRQASPGSTQEESTPREESTLSSNDATPQEGNVGYKSSGGKMVDAELGNIPEGWRVGRLADEFKIIMGQSPKGESYNEDGDGLIFFQGRADFSDRFPDVRLYTTQPKRTAEKYDVLVSVRAPVGDINVAFDTCCIGRGLAAIRSNTKSYALQKIKYLKPSFEKFEAEGTVFGSLGKNDFANVEVILPSKDIIAQFEKLTSPIDQKYFNNWQQIQTLSTLRDALLPKLMTGKLRVKGFYN